MALSARMQYVKRERKKSFYLRELSALLSRLVQDEPSLLPLYFTRIELSEDGSQCYVYCAFLTAHDAVEGERLFETGIRGTLVLYKASMRSALAAALASRYVPDLRFVFDTKKEKEQRVTDLLSKVSHELDAYDAVHSPSSQKEEDDDE